MKKRTSVRGTAKTAFPCSKRGGVCPPRFRSGNSEVIPPRGPFFHEEFAPKKEERKKKTQGKFVAWKSTFPLGLWVVQKKRINPFSGSVGRFESYVCGVCARVENSEPLREASRSTEWFQVWPWPRRHHDAMALVTIQRSASLAGSNTVGSHRIDQSSSPSTSRSSLAEGHPS